LVRKLEMAMEMVPLQYDVTSYDVLYGTPPPPESGIPFSSLRYLRGYRRTE